MDVRDAAAILGVSQNASMDQVRAAYRSHARLLHPDRLQAASEADRTAAHDAMARVNEAYEVFNRRTGQPPTISGADGQSTPKSRSTSESSNASTNGKEIARFDAVLSRPRGVELTGQLVVAEARLNTCKSWFRSDDLDARGVAVIDEELHLVIHRRFPRDGKFYVHGGGYMLIQGDESDIRRAWQCLAKNEPSPVPGTRMVKTGGVLAVVGGGLNAIFFIWVWLNYANVLIGDSIPAMGYAMAGITGGVLALTGRARLASWVLLGGYVLQALGDLWHDYSLIQALFEPWPWRLLELGGMGATIVLGHWFTLIALALTLIGGFVSRKSARPVAP